MAETYISQIKSTEWVDLSNEHKRIRTSLEHVIENTCCSNGYSQPIMLQGAFGIGKTATLNYLFHYAWEVLKVPTFHLLLSDLVDIIKEVAKQQGVDQIQNEDLGLIIKNTIDNQIQKLKNEDWSNLTNVMFPEFTSMDIEHPLVLETYLKDFEAVQIDADIDEKTKDLLSKGFTKEVIEEALNSKNVPLLLIDEFESKFTDLKKIVTSSGGGILRALFDQVVSNKPFYLIIGNGPGSAYEISKEQGTEESTDNEAAGNRRLKPMQIPFPTVQLLQQKFMHGECKGYVNFIWWVSRCRPGQIKRLHDTIDYKIYSNLDFSVFITQSIFSEPIDGTGNDAVKYLKTEYFNSIDSNLWASMGTWLLNFEPCKINVTRDVRDALMRCADAFFVSEETVKSEKIAVGLQKDLSKYLKIKQDEGLYPRVDYLKNLHKYFSYVLNACSNADGEIAFKTASRRYEESFTKAFAIPMLEIVYDFISQYEDDNDVSFKQTKDFILDCIKWTENAVEQRDLNLKYDETYRLFDYSRCDLRPNDEVMIQYSFDSIRQMIEQPIGDPRLKYKDASLDVLLSSVSMNNAAIAFAEKSDCKILFIPQLEDNAIKEYLKRVKSFVSASMPHMLHRGVETMRIVFLGNHDYIGEFKDEVLKTANGELTPAAKMSKIGIDSYDEFNFKFGGKTCDFIDSVVKIIIIGSSKGTLSDSHPDNCYDIVKVMETISLSSWSPRKEDRRTIEHYSKLVTEGENSTIDTISRKAIELYHNALGSLLCPLERYDSNLDYELSTLFDENTITYEPLSRFVCMMYIIEHAGKCQAVSQNLLELLKMVGVRSNPLYFEPKVEESSVHESYHLDQIHNILKNSDKVNYLLKHIDTSSDLYVAINNFTSMLVDEKIAGNLTHQFIKFLRNDISNHWIGEYNSVMSKYSSYEGDMLVRLSYAMSVSKMVSYDKLRQETVNRVDTSINHIQEKRSEIVDTIEDFKTDLYPIGSRHFGEPLAGYIQLLQRIISMCKLIKQELEDDSASLSTYLILETLSWRVENMKTSINTLCGQLKDIAERISRKRSEIRTKYQVPIDALLENQWVSLLINDSDPIGTIKPPFDNDILWKKYAWKIGSSDKMKYIMFEMNPSPKDKEAYFKFEDIESIRKTIESVYTDLCNSAYVPIHNLCKESLSRVQNYTTLQTYIENLINNKQDDTDR